MVLVEFTVPDVVESKNLSFMFEKFYLNFNYALSVPRISAKAKTMKLTVF